MEIYFESFTPRKKKEQWDERLKKNFDCLMALRKNGSYGDEEWEMARHIMADLYRIYKCHPFEMRFQIKKNMRDSGNE